MSMCVAEKNIRNNHIKEWRPPGPNEQYGDFLNETALTFGQSSSPMHIHQRTVGEEAPEKHFSACLHLANTLL